MAYTVKRLARLSGVSVRTLHFYDEIGLLKPAYYGENNYRYYEEAQLLMLQQILFFRELGFQLSDIQRILCSADFDKITALEAHRKVLEQNLDQTQKLIETVDKTIAHLRGKQVMKLEDIFEGFNQEKQQMYENYLVDCGVSEEVINDCKDKVQNWQETEWRDVKKEGDGIHEALVLAIRNKLHPSSPEVQGLIKRHYQLTKRFWTPNRESYKGLGELYGSHPDFRQFYAAFHPQLLEFLVAGMQIYADRELN